MQLRTRLRSLGPPAGDYELFNLAAWFYAVVLCNYLLAPPTPTTYAALSWLLGETPLLLWGIGLNAAAVTGLICSYRHDWLAVGYGVVAAAASIWFAVLAVGWGTGLADPDPWAPALLNAGAGGLLMIIVIAGLHGFLLKATTRQLVGHSLAAGAAIFALIMIIELAGDPRAFSAAVLYGFIARQAVHEAREA